MGYKLWSWGKKNKKEQKKSMAIKDKVANYIVQIIAELQNAGYETYLVGGAVRDILIDREPKDYDLSTRATPEQIRRVFGKRRARAIGRRFKIIHLYHGKEVIEISTFRAAPKPEQSNDEKHGHKHLVIHDNEYGSSRDDAFRRDFTVNAIFYDPSKDEIIDHTKTGVSDLKSAQVRVIGDPTIRFSEDPVRILRALKLVGQYNFKLTKETSEALYASLEQITLCSKSRLTLELEKILRKSYSDKILKVFQEYGFLQYFLPNIAKHWESEPTQFALQLLSSHCKRLRNEGCPDYLSTTLALIAIPFVNKQLTDDATNYLWDYFYERKKEIRAIIYNIFYPHTFPKYIISAVTDAITLQQKLNNNKNKSKRTRHHPHYRVACEVARDLDRTLSK